MTRPARAGAAILFVSGGGAAPAPSMPRDPERFPLDDRLRMQHMLDAAHHVTMFIQDRSRRDLDTDPMLVRALMNAVQEIGEAAARISDAGRERADDVPWGQIVAMRHVLVHVYLGC